MKNAPKSEAESTGITWLYDIQIMYPKIVPIKAPIILILALLILTSFKMVRAKTMPIQVVISKIAHFLVNSKINYESKILPIDTAKNVMVMIGTEASTGTYKL